MTEYLNAMARFHNYSFGNIMLIARQRPTASLPGRDVEDWLEAEAEIVERSETSMA